MFSWIAALCVSLVCLVSGAQAKSDKTSVKFPLWGKMVPGQFAVGYRVLYTFDTSRTWNITRRYGKEFSPDEKGRPIRISIWYPASRASAKQMHFGDYFLKGTPPKGFENVEADLQSRDSRILKQWIPEGYASLIATPINASLNAPAATGRFPIVLCMGGQNAPLYTNTVLAEYLASHGYVVATVFLMGPNSEQPELDLSPENVAITVRDYEFAYSIVRALPNTDATQLAMVGHSMGGSASVLFAMQNANVSAVVGLDGTYGFAGQGIRSVTEGLHYAPQKMQASLLDLRRPADDHASLDFSAVNAFKHSERYLITLARMGHSSFNTEGALGGLYGKENPSDNSGRTYLTGAEGFYWSCAVIRAFLDKVVKGDKSGRDPIKKAVAANERAAMVYKAGLPVLPNPNELLDLVEQHGFDAAIRLLEPFQREAPEEPVINASALNGLGYYLLGQKKPVRAIAAFRLVRYFYPQSANAADSLGDGYLASGQKELARQMFELVLKLAPDDTTLSTQERATLITDGTGKLQLLKDNP